MMGNAFQLQFSLITCIEAWHKNIYIQQDTKHQQFDLNCIKNQSNSYLTHPKHIILSKAYS